MRILKFITAILPPLFWGLIIFGFEEPDIAVSSIIAAIIHECGHIILMPGSSNMRGVLSGFRIKSEGIGSYRQRILGYLGGPMSNIISSLLFFTFFRGEYFRMLAMLNMATALSNLLPIEGYDGYGIILSIIEMKECGSLSHRVLTRVSTGLILCFTIFSLYLMDRVGGGYWIFAIFFSFLIKVIDRDISKAF